MSFYDNFVECCDEIGLTPTEVARSNGITQQAVSLWKKRGSIPKAETLYKLANFFGVTVGYMLDGLEGMNNREAKKYEDRFFYFDDVWETMMEEIGQHLSFLNSEGQKEAVKRVEELTEIPRYRRQEPAQPPAQKTVDSTEGKDTPAAQDAPEGAKEAE